MRILPVRRHQHHPPVHLRQILLLVSFSAPLLVSASPITIVLSHPEAPLSPLNGSTSATAINTSTSTYQHHSEILHGNNTGSDSDISSSNYNGNQIEAAAAASTALVKAHARAKATSLPRQEFYLQDKRTGSGSSASATTTSAKHVLEGYKPSHAHDGVDNVSILHKYGYGGDVDDDYDRILIRIDDDDGATYRVRKLPVVNSPFQFGLLVVILLVSLTANGCVILNISRDSLKLKMIHFLLIRHVCLTDFLGTLFILPLPMVAIIRGEWTESSTSNRICAVVSTTTALFWTMHLIAVALYRTDRVLAVWLPSGRYPVCSIRVVNFCLVSVWLTAIVGSCLATLTFGYTFQPALALCIPDVPIIFFIVVFSGYCIGLIALSTGYILAFARKRKRRRKGKKAMLQAQMAAAVGAAQRCLLQATGQAPSGNHNNRLASALDGPCTQTNNVWGLGRGHRHGRVVNVLQHQMTGFSDDFVPLPLQKELDTTTPLPPGERDDFDATGDFYTKNCIRNSRHSHSPDPGQEPGPDPDLDPNKTPTSARPTPPALVSQFGFGGNVNALPSCIITPIRPSVLDGSFPDPADDASTADSCEGDESATTPTGTRPETATPPAAAAAADPIEPIVRCPHHFLEQGYQVLRSSSEDLSSSSSSSAESSGSSSCMLPGARAGIDDGNGSGSGSDKKKILRKKIKKPNNSASACGGIARRITHQSLSLRFSSNTNSISASAPAPARVKSAGAGGVRGHERKVPTHSKSFDCYYDLLEQRFDVERPHSVHVAPDSVLVDPDGTGDYNHHDGACEDLEMALVDSHPPPSSGSRASSRLQFHKSNRRTPTPIATPAVAIEVNRSLSRSRSASNCSSSLVGGYVNGVNGDNGNGTYSNSLNTQDDEEEEEEDHSPYIDVIHDQIDHFRFHVHERHTSNSGRSSRADKDKAKAKMVGYSICLGSGKEQQKKHHHHRHRHGHRQHHKHAKKSTDAKKRALLSYALSVGHLLLYLPAMFVVGLQGSSLPPGAALFCGIVVYCEFLIQPAALMILSHRLRTEIIRMLTGRRPISNQLSSAAIGGSGSNQLI